MATKKPDTAMKKLNRALMAINKMTDAEIEECESVAREQVSYIHPLKYATAAKYNKLGEHNIAVLAKVKELRTIMKKLKL